MMTLKRIWKDPVWSKVIAAIICFLGAQLFSFIKGLIDNTETITFEKVKDSFLMVLKWKVNVWLFLALFLFLFIVLPYIIKTIKNSKSYSDSSESIPPIPPFVNGFTKGSYLDQTWEWSWKWSSKFEFYYIDELHMVCPNCLEGALFLDGNNNYRCVKCGVSIPFNIISIIDEDDIKNQILLDAKKKYPDNKEQIGSFKNMGGCMV